MAQQTKVSDFDDFIPAHQRAIAKQTIEQVGRFLRIPLDNVEIRIQEKIKGAPPGRALWWRGTIKGTDVIATHPCFFSAPPSDKDVVTAIRRSGTFALTVGINPANSYLWEAYSAWEFAYLNENDDRGLLVALLNAQGRIYLDKLFSADVQDPPPAYQAFNDIVEAVKDTVIEQLNLYRDVLIRERKANTEDSS